MKKSILKNTIIVLLAIILPISCFAIHLPISAQNNALKSEQAAITSTISQITSYIPDDVFGGIYIDSNSNIIVNITNTSIISSIPSTCSSNYNVVYNVVDLSLGTLESVKNSLSLYMKDYNIATIDANEVTNTIDIELYATNENIYALTDLFIDRSYVNVTVLSDSTSFEATGQLVSEDNSPEEGNYMAEYANQSLSTRALGTIYPGAKIKKGNYYYTAGPRYSSNQFRTAGHAASDDLTQFTFYISHLGGDVEIGTQGSVIFGAGGDRLNVTLTGGTLGYVLPSTNSFVMGSGTYTYASPYVGLQVEMHGAFSSITSGTVTATNVQVYLSDYDITVTNLARASYTCQRGDSGAGIFSSNAFNTTGYCYGTQSIGVFPSGSSTSSYSYFSQH